MGFLLHLTPQVLHGGIQLFRFGFGLGLAIASLVPHEIQEIAVIHLLDLSVHPRHVIIQLPYPLFLLYIFIRLLFGAFQILEFIIIALIFFLSVVYK